MDRQNVVVAVCRMVLDLAEGLEKVLAAAGHIGSPVSGHEHNRPFLYKGNTYIYANTRWLLCAMGRCRCLLFRYSL